jgi:hypothetical protein
MYMIITCFKNVYQFSKIQEIFDLEEILSFIIKGCKLLLSCLLCIFVLKNATRTFKYLRSQLYFKLNGNSDC